MAGRNMLAKTLMTEVDTERGESRRLGSCGWVVGVVVVNWELLWNDN